MIVVITLLIITHLIADFYLQADWMAKNKSTSNTALIAHVSVYVVCLLVPSLYLFCDPLDAFFYVFLNGILHGLTDYVTSRISSKFYKENRNHAFFSTVGTDQAIHMLTLIWTYQFVVTI